MGEAENSGEEDGDGASHDGILWGRVAEVMDSDISGVVVEGIVMTGGTYEETM